MGVCSAEQALELCPDHRVAFAGCLLQRLPVQHFNRATAIPDHACLLQNSCSNTHRRPSRPKHLREKFLRQQDRFISHSIMRHQDPPSEALLHRVKTVAGGCLRNLCVEGLRITVEHGRRTHGNAVPAADKSDGSRRTNPADSTGASCTPKAKRPAYPAALICRAIAPRCRCRG